VRRLLAPTGFALALLAGAGCIPRDPVVRKDVESIQTNVEQIETTLQSRQAGVNEQIRDIREDQARLENLLEENRRQIKDAGQKLALLREATQEDMARRDRAAQDAAAAESAAVARLGERVDGVQKGLQTVNDSLVSMSAFEKKQEERIVHAQEQLQGQLKVVVDEVGQENQALAKSVAALRTDLDAARQDAGATRQGLVDLQKAMQQIADQLAATQSQVQEFAKRQEGQRRAAAVGRKAGGEHVVKAGETLTSIAGRYGVSVQSLMEKNRITDPKTLSEGQKLEIPER
jgi:LysM repeat protein